MADFIFALLVGVLIGAAGLYLEYKTGIFVGKKQLVIEHVLFSSLVEILPGWEDNAKIFL